MKRIATAIRFDPETHEALKETAEELGVGMNWLVNKLCVEGLERMDLTLFRFTRPRSGPAPEAPPQPAQPTMNLLQTEWLP